MSNGEKPWKRTVINPELRKMPWMLTLMIIILAVFPEIVGCAMYVALQNSPDEYWIGIVLVIFTSLLVGLTITLFLIYRRALLQRASWLLNTQQARTMIMTKGNRILGRSIRGEMFPRLRTVDSAEAYIFHFQPLFQSKDQINDLNNLAEQHGEEVKVFQSADLPSNAVLVWRCGTLIGRLKK